MSEELIDTHACWKIFAISPLSRNDTLDSLCQLDMKKRLLKRGLL
jgi:hypothetical protein